MDQKQSLQDAIAALRQFRNGFTVGETIDAESGLTADHLAAIISSVETLSKDVVGEDPEQG